MSLINQMLKDLEARQSPKDTNSDSPLKGLGASRRQQKPKVSKKFWFVVLPVFVIVLIILLVPTDDKQDSDALPPEIATAQAKQTTAATDQQALFDALVGGQNLTQQPGAQGGATAPAVAALATQKSITGVLFTQNNGIGVLDFQLQDAHHYYDFLQSEQDKLVSIIFYDTTVDPNILKGLTENLFIENVTAKQQGNNTQVNVALKDNVQVASLDFSESSTPPELKLALQMQKTAAPQAAQQNQASQEASDGGMKKVDVPLTQDQKAEKARSQAIHMYEDGKTLEAIQLLNGVLDDYPAFKPARETLVILLLDYGQPGPARSILLQGLAQSPSYVPFVVLEARIEASKGDPHGALKVLEKVSPSLKEYPEYYALLAGVQQSMGNYEVSEQIYRQLILLQPDNGVWWIGYGISLEANGKRHRAIEAYKRATTTGGLNSKLQIYANSRISALGG